MESGGCGVKQAEHYFIDGKTMGVFPYFTTGEGRKWAYILEEREEVLVARSPLQVIEDSCLYWGSDLKGRKRGTKAIAGYTHKPPIVIDDLCRLYFFPLKSPEDDTCPWLSHEHLESVYQNDAGETVIQFCNGREKTVDVSPRVVVRNQTRTAQLRIQIENRKIKKQIRPGAMKV